MRYSVEVEVQKNTRGRWYESDYDQVSELLADAISDLSVQIEKTTFNVQSATLKALPRGAKVTSTSSQKLSA